MRRWIMTLLANAALFGATVTGVSAQTPAEDTIQQVRRESTLRVCLAESQPFTVKTPDGKWQGMNVELAEDLARVMGVKLQAVDVTYATMIAALQGRQCSIIMAPAFATAERALQVVFTQSYNATGEVVLVQRDAPWKDASELDRANVTFAVLAGTTNERTARQMFPRAQIRTFATDSQVAPVLEVANRRAEANIADLNSARRFLQVNPNAPVRLLSETPLNKSFRAFMVRPGDWHFLAFVNTWIAVLQSSGRLDKIAATYGVE